MPRTPDWRREVSEALNRENWALRGPKCIVKVIPLRSQVVALGGYITQGRYLLGKTPQQIENVLGLERDYLKFGANICRFMRLPMQHEYEYELTAHYPGGLTFNPAHSDPRFLPGDRAIHQWRIKKGIQIPVDQTSILELGPSECFPYDWLVK